MQEIRCPKCKKLLFKLDIDPKLIDKFVNEIAPNIEYVKYDDLPMSAKIALENASKHEVKCPRCGAMNTNKGECQNDRGNT